jgi:hypothetical protein
MRTTPIWAMTPTGCDQCVIKAASRRGRSTAKSSKPIGKTKIEEHNCIRGRGLLQKLSRNETGEVQRCEEMLAYGPTNLKVGLTPDKARAAKVRRSYWHVLKAVEREHILTKTRFPIIRKPFLAADLIQSIQSMFPASRLTLTAN